MGKNIDKNISKISSNKYGAGMLAMCQKLLDHAKQSGTDHLKLLQKESFKKQQKQLVIFFVIKLLKEL